MRYRPPKGFGPKGQKPFIHLEDILGGFGGPRRPQPSPPSIEYLAPGAGRAPARGPFRAPPGWTKGSPGQFGPPGHPGFIGGPVRPGGQPFRGPGGPGAGGPVMPGRPPQGGIMPPPHAPLMPEEDEEQGFGPMQGQFGEMDPVMAMILQRALARSRRFQ